MGTEVTITFLSIVFILACLSIYKACHQETTSSPFISREEILSRIPSIRKLRKIKNLTFAFILLSCALLFVVWNNTPTRLGDYVYIERNLNTHKQIIHTNSSCSKIKEGYSIINTKYYENNQYIDAFCPKCVYESDAIKLTK